MNWRGSRVTVAIASIGDLVLAAGTWLGWMAAGHSGTRAALAVLIVATPVGLILAQQMPVRIARRIGRSLSVIHFDPGAPDVLPRVQRLVIDTHKIVTTGHLVVTDVSAFDPDNDRNLRWFAGALAHRSDKPVNRAIAHLAGTGRTTGFAEEPERGIRGSVDRHPVRVGNADWLGMDWPGRSGSGGTGTTVGVEVDHRPMGHITVADEVRHDARTQLASLRRTGIDPVLVSAASEPNLARIAQLCGAEEWYAGADIDSVADKLGRADTGTVRSVPSGEVEMLLLDASVNASDSSIGAVVRVLELMRCTRRARVRATRLASLGIALPLPFAAAGLLTPVIAAVLAIAVLVVVGLGAVVTNPNPGTPA